MSGGSRVFEVFFFQDKNGKVRSYSRMGKKGYGSLDLCFFSYMYLVLYSNRYVVIDVIKLLIVDVDWI